MSRLSWVRGNSVLMTVTLIQKNTDGTETPIDLSTYDAWACKVWRMSAYKKVETEVVVALDQSGQVVLSIPASIPCGTYSVEVICAKAMTSGGLANRRSYETPVFAVVESNGEAHTTYDVVECQLSADIEMLFQLTPMATQLGQNAYEMWKELPGHADKTLQEYIDEVLDLNTITAACVAATEAAEEAASQVSNPDYIGEDNYVYHWNGTAYEKTDIYCKGDTGDTGATGATGAPGADGADGADGVGISSITFKQTDAQGNNIYTITLTNGNSYDFTSPKGAQGADGADGADGAPGADGQDGSDGQDGQDGVGIDDIEFKETDAQGNNVYTITLTDGNSYDFTAPKGAPGSSGSSAWSDITGKPTTIAGYGITDAKIESGTITLGSDTITPLTSHQSISGKADKVTSATNGNFAALDSNGNLTDSGHKHGDYLTSHQDLSNYVQKSNTAGLLKNDGTIDTSTYLTSAHEVPAGGNAGQVLAKNSATNYDLKWVNQTQYYPSAYCTTAAGTAAKVASCSLWVATANSYLHVLIGQANTSASALTLNVNSTGAKPVYINGSASSSSNYTLPAGTYIVFYDGTNFHFRTDGKIPGPSGSTLVRTSSTSGLLKNDGSVDTNTYLSSQTDGVDLVNNAIASYINNDDLPGDIGYVNEDDGTPSLFEVYSDYVAMLCGFDDGEGNRGQALIKCDKASGIYLENTIPDLADYHIEYLTLDGTEQLAFVSDLPDVSGYEERVGVLISLPGSGALEPNRYYALPTALTGAVTITLPSISSSVYTVTIGLSFSTGSGFTSLTITPPTGKTVEYYDGYAIEASKKYEINLLYNGSKWIVSYAVIG